MFGIVLLTLVLISLASIYSDLMMRIRLTKRLPPENGLPCWMRSSDEVGRTYQELLPGSYLPSIIPYVFWLFLATAAAAAVLVALRKSI
jgi:hypothetical protein